MTVKFKLNVIPAPFVVLYQMTLVVLQESCLTMTFFLPYATGLNGGYQDELVDHRLTEREWADEWKHLDQVRLETKRLQFKGGPPFYPWCDESYLISTDSVKMLCTRSKRVATGSWDHPASAQWQHTCFTCSRCLVKTLANLV